MNLEFQTNAAALPAWRTIDARIERLDGGVDTDLEPAFLAFGEAERQLDRLFEPDCICVTTGQQPGLLTGPLFTIYKALTAAALAKRLEMCLNRAVVPVFWVAGDDHDFAEVNHCFVPTGQGAPEKFVLRERDPLAPLTPMYREQLGSDIESVLEGLEQLSPDTEFRAEFLGWLRSSYRPDSDVASAFAGAMAQLLGRFGVVVLQPTREKAKSAMASWVVRALENAANIDRALAEYSDALKSRGEPAPISSGNSASTVLIESEMGRDRLLFEHGEFFTRRGNERWTLDALKEVAANDPQRLSPNVLLRPVVEAAILPTIAYVAGPGEMKYLPQATPIYELFDVEPQIPVPRWSGLCIENRTAKVLTKYGITTSDLALPEGQLEARVLREKMPEEAEKTIEEIRTYLDDKYGDLEESTQRLEDSLKKPIVAARRNALRDLAGVEKKIVGALKRSNETTVRQLSNARSSIFPLSKPQERIHTVAPYLIRYGNAFLDAAHEQCTQWAAALESSICDT